MTDVKNVRRGIGVLLFMVLLVKLAYWVSAA